MQVLVDTAERRITHVIAINDADTPLAVGPATVSDGLAPLPIVKGHLTGQAEGGSVSGGAWVNGAAVVLEQDIQNAPSVLLLGGGAAAEMRQQKWTNGFDPNRPVRIERDAIQVSAAGFIPRARFVQDLGTFTARDDNFPGTVIDVVDESVEVTLANSPAHDDKYTTRVQFTLNPGGWPADVPNGIAQYVGYVEAYFAIEFDDGGGYVERSGFFVSHGGPDSVNFVFQQSRQLAVSGMGSGDKVRVALRSLYLQNGLGSVSAVAQDVKYDTASSAASYASMTPDQAATAADRVEFQLLVTT
ncbi:MAG: hypothetical protein ACRENP_21105, partial [Longimicrobiales bacterium]